MVYEMELDGWLEEFGFVQLRSVEKISFYLDSYNGIFVYCMVLGQEYGFMYWVFLVVFFDEFEYCLQARQDRGMIRFVFLVFDVGQFYFIY